jgi:hypothetical protein
VSTVEVVYERCAGLDIGKDSDVPTATFGRFGASGRPAVVYQMLWGLPRV